MDASLTLSSIVESHIGPMCGTINQVVHKLQDLDFRISNMQDLLKDCTTMLRAILEFEDDPNASEESE